MSRFEKSVMIVILTAVVFSPCVFAEKAVSVNAAQVKEYRIERKLSEKSQPGVNGRSSPSLESPESHAVQFGQNRKHMLCAHSGRRQ